MSFFKNFQFFVTYIDLHRLYQLAGANPKAKEEFREAMCFACPEWNEKKAMQIKEVCHFFVFGEFSRKPVSREL